VPDISIEKRPVPSELDSYSHLIILWRMTVREILLLGNPRLYDVSKEVHESEIDSVKQIVADLHDTMMAFRAKYGVGRAIAAPQIGALKRIIYMNIDRPVIFVNPVLKDLSTEMIEVWDDCMCFPDLLVKVKRHRSCTIEYRDETWTMNSLVLKDDLSELLQHEYDHLEGILAVSRAINGKSYAYKDQKSRWYD
jgi:peptide deformylase